MKSKERYLLVEIQNNERMSSSKKSVKLWVIKKIKGVHLNIYQFLYDHTI
jgi:hypothetical protein